MPFLEVLLSIFKLKSDAKYELCHQSLSAFTNIYGFFSVFAHLWKIITSYCELHSKGYVLYEGECIVYCASPSKS